MSNSYNNFVQGKSYIAVCKTTGKSIVFAFQEFGTRIKIITIPEITGIEKTCVVGKIVRENIDNQSCIEYFDVDSYNFSSTQGN